MSYVDYEVLAARVRAKQAGRGLREIAEEIGDISASTLSRLLRNAVTDMSNTTFLRICDWLGVEPEEFIILEDSDDAGPVPDISTPDKISLQLRADPELDSATAAMLAEMVRAAYDRARKREGN